MNLINGTEIAAKVVEETKSRIAACKKRGVTPGLAVVMVGENPASLAYVRRKDKIAGELGILSKKIELPTATTQDELLAVVANLNADPEIHGILVQSPPPVHIDEAAIVRAVDPRKDVDGLHPENVAKLVLDDPSGFAPCTPLGCQRLLAEAGVETRGANIVMVGRSMLVGKPLALLLMARGAGGDATVTVAHSRSNNLAAITREADIVIAAIGRAGFVTADMVRDGAIVIDVGINRVEDASAKRGYRIVGDVDFDAVAPKCAAITPVPGGVGPMTIAMLMANTVTAAER